MTLGLLISAAAVTVAPVPKEALFGQWTAACDNARHCEAIGLPPEGGAEGEWTLHVTREAPGAALPTAETFPAFGEGDPGPTTLRIDGKATDFAFDSDGQAVGDVRTILAAVAAARGVEMLNREGKPVGTVPVAGASAALRWMDDRQQRVGTVTALIARGAAPVTSVPPAPALPRIPMPPSSSAPPRKLTAADVRRIQALADDLCDADRASQTTYRLDAGHSVGIVGCMMGAYQGASLIVVIDEAGKWRPAPIEQAEALPKSAEPYDGYILTEGDYDPDRRLLLTVAKGRGLGDCGETASWARDGSMFRLASYSALHQCLGALPGTWLSR